MKNIKWTERKFDFGYTTEYLNLFIERLKCTAPRIEELTRNISEEECSFMPEGKWSIKQHIGHLIDLDELHDGRLNDFRKKLEVLRAADMTNLKTEEANHNKTSVAELINNFRSARKKFIDHVMKFDEKELDQKAIHPRLQKQINIIDLLYFIAEHDLFHLEIMSRISDQN